MWQTLISRYHLMPRLIRITLRDTNSHHHVCPLANAIESPTSRKISRPRGKSHWKIHRCTCLRVVHFGSERGPGKIPSAGTPCLSLNSHTYTSKLLSSWCSSFIIFSVISAPNFPKLHISHFVVSISEDSLESGRTSYSHIQNFGFPEVSVVKPMVHHFCHMSTLTLNTKIL